MTAGAVVAKSAPVRIVTAMTGSTILGGSLCRSRCSVTRRAGQAAMGAGESEFRPGIVIEGPGQPVARVVAGSALPAERAAVAVFIAMAVATRLAGIMEGGGGVALGACQLGMPAHQRKLSEVVIETDLGDPGRRNMAALADGAELTGVHVVVAVTTAAVCWQGIADGALMACGAPQFTMTGRQSKARACGVIKINPLPCRCDMTTVAVVAVIAVVDVVGLMTRCALAAAQIFVIGCLVTVLTSQSGMAAVERERRHGLMIESGVGPAQRDVAGAAIRAVAALMHVLGLVARRAGATDLGEGLTAMTGRTAGIQMSAE